MIVGTTAGVRIVSVVTPGSSTPASPSMMASVAAAVVVVVVIVIVTTFSVVVRDGPSQFGELFRKVHYVLSQVVFVVCWLFVGCLLLRSLCSCRLLCLCSHPFLRLTFMFVSGADPQLGKVKPRSQQSSV